jgi:hypothetical protein
MQLPSQRLAGILQVQNIWGFFAAFSWGFFAAFLHHLSFLFWGFFAAFFFFLSAFL